MKIGIIEILENHVPRNWIKGLPAALYGKFKTSIMPQAIAVWCRQLGHEVYYATYCGQKDPKSLLPNNLDFVFISTATRMSAVAYALAKLYRNEGVLTVAGGPHAKSFPTDCLRFFDFVVINCDKQLIDDLLKGDFEQKKVISSNRLLKEIPTIEERMSEIASSTFFRGKPTWATFIPILTSTGCPYSCDFCVDWNNKYFSFSPERIKADLTFLSTKLPGVKFGIHDPNFGVNMDRVLSLIEEIPPRARNPFAMESSLLYLNNAKRLRRLKEANCVCVMPSIESWYAYSDKSGARNVSGYSKLQKVIDDFRLIQDYIPAIAANIIFGTEADCGNEPVELTKQFIKMFPNVWPSVTLLCPYGRTPLYNYYLAQDRILKSIPFAFYDNSHLVMIPKNYHPLEYFTKMLEICNFSISMPMFMRRMAAKTPIYFKSLIIFLTCSVIKEINSYKEIINLFNSDKQFRDFYEGQTTTLPELYHRHFEENLGPYASLISREERIPEHEPAISDPTKDSFAVPR